MSAAGAGFAVRVKVTSAPSVTVGPPVMLTTGSVNGDCAAAGMILI